MRKNLMQILQATLLTVAIALTGSALVPTSAVAFDDDCEFLCTGGQSLCAYVPQPGGGVRKCYGWPI